jgi:hypothetical protein
MVSRSGRDFSRTELSLLIDKRRKSNRHMDPRYQIPLHDVPNTWLSIQFIVVKHWQTPFAQRQRRIGKIIGDS